MTSAIGATPSQLISDLGRSTPAVAPTNTLGGDDFLKLLVAQLKYQDPSNPMDGTALMGQTAQFQMVEQLQKLSDQNLQMLSEQQASSAIALVGKTVSFTSGDQTMSGVVGSVRLSSTGPVLTVGSSDVPLSAVTEISAAG